MTEKEKNDLLNKVSYIGQQIIANPKDGFATQDARNVAIEVYIKLKETLK